LLVWAMEDKALSPSNIEGIEELVPNIHIERVANCGHFVTWEKPDAVIAAMEKFLA
jgi:pimeloyl-ACP methyl ester carboxylesterase